MTNGIADIIQSAFKDATGRATGYSELTSWQNSLQYMDRILSAESIPDSVGIAIEYHIPQSSKRIDFIVTGQNADKEDLAILIELKQWQKAEITHKDGIVKTRFKHGEKETAHPSYQAWSYKCLLEDYNKTVQDEKIKLLPCAYLHNYDQDDVITNELYENYTEKAPVFLKSDATKLQSFIASHVKHGDKSNIMYRIDHGKIKPSKNLADQLSSMLKGNEEFTLIDDQKVAFETALDLSIKAPTQKQVLIIEGGPGTGKSVLAINLLVQLTNNDKVAQYVTRNSAPRLVYEAKLSGSFTKSRISNMFSGSGSFHATAPNLFDCLLIDEAHRLNEKSGMFSHLGENQVKELIDSSKLSVFFIDEDQRVTLKDIGTKDEIHFWATRLGAKVTSLNLESQFRCNGSGGYLAWLDNSLQIKNTANKDLESIDYDFRIFDDPREMHDLILKKNEEKNRARVLAGYCWKWNSKKNPAIKDIIIGDYEATWNLDSQGQAWIIHPDSATEVGCIHTSQGLEVDYVGVIVGADFIVREGRVITDVMERASSDGSVKGRLQLLKDDPERAYRVFDSIIKNTYRTLMTRGQKGCYVYFVDEETRNYFKKLI